MEKHKKSGISAAILTMSLVQMSTNGIAPVLAELAREFPAASPSSIQFLMTFPSLFVVAFSLLSGLLARRIQKKALAAAGCGLVAASGMCAFLIHPSLEALFLWAGVMGTGVGLVVPVAASLVADHFTGTERSSMMGLQSGAANAGGMLMAFFGGLLAAHGWHWNYLVYLIALPGLVLSITALPRTAEGVREGKAAEDRGNLHGMLYPCLMAVLVTTLFNLVPTNLSMYLTENNIGSAVEAGKATTLLLLGGAAMAAAFGPIRQKLGGKTVMPGFGLLAVGLLLCANAHSMALICLGSLISGGSISLVMPQLMLRATTEHGRSTALASALVMGCSNLGAFLTPLFTELAALLFGRPDAGCRFLLGAGAAFLIAVLQLAAEKTGQLQDGGTP